MSRNGKPIPTKFGPLEEEIINQLHELYGLSKSEVIRRCVRLLRVEVTKRHGATDWFTTELTPKKFERYLSDPGINKAILVSEKHDLKKASG